MQMNRTSPALFAFLGLPLVAGCPARTVMVPVAEVDASKPGPTITKAEFSERVLQPACKQTYPRCLEVGTKSLEEGKNVRTIVLEMCSADQHPANMGGAYPEEFDCYSVAAEGLDDAALLALVEACATRNEGAQQRGHCVRTTLKDLAPGYEVVPSE